MSHSPGLPTCWPSYCGSVLILLPPSEGKTAPQDGPRLKPDALSFGSLAESRAQTLQHLVDLCRGDPERAERVLKLGPTQVGEIERNAVLADEPTAPALDVYSGVLFAALDHARLDGDAHGRARDRLVIASALFGLLRPDDPIPAYRLSAAVRLPGLGSPRQVWAGALRQAITEAAGDGVIVDMRSGAYAKLFAPAVSTPLAHNWVTLRVLTRRGGRLVSVSHHNKHTKGVLARDLVRLSDVPSGRRQLCEALRDLGWSCEPGQGTAVDVVI